MHNFGNIAVLGILTNYHICQGITGTVINGFPVAINGSLLAKADRLMVLAAVRMIEQSSLNLIATLPHVIENIFNFLKA